MLNTIAFDLAALAGAFYALAPLAVRWTYRFAARCTPVAMPVDSLPQQAAAVFRQRIPEIEELGFELTGCFDCGELQNHTRSYLAQFVNRRSNDLATISALVTPTDLAWYLEFSTRFTGGVVVETNTNGALPLTPAIPESKVFRFPEIDDARTLLRVHHQLVDKHAPGSWPQPEPPGQEIQRFVQVVENYGPRHARLGYMRLADDGKSYKLTWKGAFLMTWRGLWPVSLVRRWLHAHTMHSELLALQQKAVAALQKA